MKKISFMRKEYTVEEFAQVFNLDEKIFVEMLDEGMSVTKAKNRAKKEVKVKKAQKTVGETYRYNGHDYKNIMEVARAAGVPELYRAIARVWKSFGNGEKSMEECIAIAAAIRKRGNKTGNRTSCFDHLGNLFESESAMASHYGKNISIVSSRLEEGWTLENALLAPEKTYEIDFILEKGVDNMSKADREKIDAYGLIIPEYDSVEAAIASVDFVNSLKIAIAMKRAFLRKVKKDLLASNIDHTGKRYISNKAMRKAWNNVSEELFIQRLLDGRYSLEETLVIPSNYTRERYYKESKAIEAAGYGSGKTFESFATERGLTMKNIYSRGKRYDHKYGVNARFTVEGINNLFMREVIEHREALDPVDHLGQRFDSLDEMCDYWDVERTLFNNRMRMGWTLEAALTTPKRIPQTPKVDHLGKSYRSFAELCNAWDKPRMLVYSRLRCGWSVERCLTEEKRFNGVDHVAIANKLDEAGFEYSYQETIKNVCFDLGLEEEYEEMVENYMNIMKELNVDQFGRTVVDNMKFNFILLKDGRIVGMIDKLRKLPAFVQPLMTLVQRLWSGQDQIATKKLFSETSSLPYLIVRDDQMGCFNQIFDQFISNPNEFVSKHVVSLDESELFEREDELMERIVVEMAVA